MVLNLTTAESIQVMIAYHDLLNKYEEQWKQKPTEDHQQEREWYRDTLSKIATAVSDALHEDTDLTNYLALEQTDEDGSVDLYSAFQYEHTK